MFSCMKQYSLRNGLEERVMARNTLRFVLERAPTYTVAMTKGEGSLALTGAGKAWDISAGFPASTVNRAG